MSTKAHAAAPYTKRFAALKERLHQHGLNGVILVPGPNMRYYTGVNSLLLERPFLLFVPTEGNAHLVAPTLESGPYRRAPITIEVHAWTDNEGPSNAFQTMVNRLSMNGKWGLEGKVPYLFIHHLQRHVKSDFEIAEPILQQIREIKDGMEIRSLQRAASILCKSFEKIPDLLKVGTTELELAKRISETIYSYGAESVGDVLVQSGPMASNPHHLPTTVKIKRKASIVVDTACTYSGYFADITRTYMIGSNKEFESIYEKVLEAQQQAILAAKPGVTAGSVDSAARNLLKANHLDGYFIHRTGHGLGLEVHEAPYITAGSDELLEPSMVFTIEPGVYIPSKTGVRIEDNVVITNQGHNVITKTLPKEFGWWR